MFFCPPQHKIGTSEELQIFGVGDVTIKDEHHRVTTGSFGIYAYEVDPTTKAKRPVFIYPHWIKTNT